VVALPSFIFLVFESVNDQRFVGWEAFRDSIDEGTVVTGPPNSSVRRPPRASGGVGIWRLVAPNNRELGRSWSSYPTFDDAREHVLQLQHDIGEVVVSGVRGSTSSQYSWVASLGSARVITAGRWYGASSTSLQAAATTLAAFASAEVVDKPVSPPRELAHAARPLSSRGRFG
jgi:hypothetical protein